jgi:hypothetical protein
LSQGVGIEAARQANDGSVGEEEFDGCGSGSKVRGRSDERDASEGGWSDGLFVRGSGLEGSATEVEGLFGETVALATVAYGKSTLTPEFDALSPK